MYITHLYWTFRASDSVVYSDIARVISLHIIIIIIFIIIIIIIIIIGKTRMIGMLKKV